MKHQPAGSERQYRLTVNAVDYGLVWLEPSEFLRLGGYTYAKSTESFSRMGVQGLEVYTPTDKVRAQRKGKQW